MSEPRSLTAEEAIKATSHHLRGGLLEDITDGRAGLSNADSEHLVKFHGIYAQDNRDVRRERTLAKESLEYIFMIRVAIPGGRLSSTQWLALDAIAEDIADGSIRLTTRQAVQFHGVLKGELQELAGRLASHTLTSFAGCGDVVRNTVMCPDLVANADSALIVGVADHIAATFRPKSRAHVEIFVDGQLAATLEDSDEHEFYGDTYLPRKFKIAIAHPHENCVDVLAQDVGLIPATHPELGEGFNVTVAGGLGRNYATPDTFARLAEPLTFVSAHELDDLISAVITTFRDLGDRTNRRRARLKYVAADLGPERFRSEIEQRYGAPLRLALPVELGDADDHLGWRTLSDGTHELGIRVGAGRVKDLDGWRLRSALRTLASTRELTFLITAQQDLVISGIDPGDDGAVAELLREHGVAAVESLGSVERNALSCVALPTCGQALAEAERILPDVIATLETSLARTGNAGRPLQLRLTGCPNGCARPAVAEVGLVGRTKTSYDLFLGGGPRGDRLAVLHQEKVKLDDVAAVLEPLLERWRDEGLTGEAFGDFYVRAVAS